MSPRQMKYYRGQWAKVLAVCPDFTDEDRRAIHASVGAPPSSKDFKQEDFDKVLAEFWKYLRPDSLNSQIRQIEQPETRLLKRINDQVKCLALFVEYPDAYLKALLKNRFHVEHLEDIAHRPSPIAHGGKSDLEMLRDTLADRIAKFRREAIGPDGSSMSEHDMCVRAGVPCFRKACAECRDSKSPIAHRPSPIPESELNPF